MLSINGRTDNGYALGGIFYMQDTVGLPLADILSNIGNNVPDWIAYIADAKNAGWSKHTTYVRIREAVLDTHGILYWVKIKSRIQEALS